MIKDWFWGLRKYFLCASAAVLVTAGVCRAQDGQADLRALIERQGKLIESQGKQLEELKQRLEKTGPANPASSANLMPSLPGAASEKPDREGLQERLERLEKQNQQLLETLKKLPMTPTSPLPFAGDLPGLGGNADPSLGQEDVRKIVADYLQAQEERNKAAEEARKAEAAEKGFVVGKDLGMKAYWNHGAWVETADKAFRVHVGGRTQFDTVGSWAPDNVQFSVPGGIGSFLDAVNFRRARLAVDGWFYEVFDFNCEYDFVNTFDTGKTVNTNDDFGGRIANIPVPNHLSIGINYLPILGMVRLGNMKPPIGFEHLTSSRHLNFLERSFQFDAFIENGDNGFSPGLKIQNWTENERLSWQFGIFNNNRSVMGWNVGNGEWQYVGRVTGLPWYQDNGRYMLHLGLGAAFDNLDDGNTRFRSRTLIRNGPAALHNIVAFARMDGENEIRLNPEIFLNLGPFSMQAEYIPVWVNGANRIIGTPTQTNVAISPRQYFAQGCYVEALYFLTGEHRQYTKTSLHSSGPATGRVIPNRNFFWVPGQGSGNPFSCGAWQVAARYSYLDLTNNGINGGQLNDVTLGLNWYLNPNFKIQWNYSHGWRSIPNSPASGDFQQVGMRVAFDF